ncbi:MAG: hypothetical protein JSU80_14235 [Deltaproteobacteria bacterium]|nr:MAG: hypothetical protein JSU80_14235 [Deltaproteobacteria bacterium]
MLKEEKAFLVVMSMAMGALVCSVAIIGKYLSLTKSMLLGLAFALLYPTFIIAMVRFSVALRSWAHGEKFDDWVASGRETIRTYLFLFFPIVLPVLVVFYLSFGIIIRIFNYKAA